MNDNDHEDPETIAVGVGCALIVAVLIAFGASVVLLAMAGR